MAEHSSRKPEQAQDPSGAHSGCWYLAQAAERAWQIHARSVAGGVRLRALAALLRYPAYVTASGELLHLQSSLRRLLRLRPQ
jgi:hypothetical protein